MTHPWSSMKWWDSGERQAAEEKLDDDIRAGHLCTPERRSLYRSLSVTPEPNVRVAIIGQDPYPTAGMATGVAFSVPREVSRDAWPQTLRIILAEYASDLGYCLPGNGDLTGWADKGVLLWNAIPVCRVGKSLSCDYEEWNYLTGEIIDRLSARGIVFALLGGIAQRFESRIGAVDNRVIRVSHPSPRGIRSSNTPFTGSRLFSTINAKLVELGKEKIDWELKDEPPRKSDLQGTQLGGGNVLPNVTGANLGGLKKQGTSPNIYTSLMF